MKFFFLKIHFLGKNTPKMTIFEENGTAKNRNFGRIWKPKPKKRKKNSQKFSQKRERKKGIFKKKKGQKKVSAKADFSIFFITEPPTTSPMGDRPPPKKEKGINLKKKKGQPFPLKAGKPIKH